MGLKRAIRVRIMLYVSYLIMGMVAVIWSASWSYRRVWTRPSAVSIVALGRLRSAHDRTAHVHEWWLAVRAFERVMDSLRKDSTKVHVYDSIVRVRPGLMDSLRHAEGFFYLQDHLRK